MSKPKWKSIADNLETGDASAHYADRVPAGEATDAFGAIQKEVIEEMSDGLRRAARKIEECLVDLADIDEALESSDDRVERRKLVERFNAKRSEALEARRNYLIQREAIGFYQNDVVQEEYPIPPKRMLAGPNGEDGCLNRRCEKVAEVECQPDD